MQSKRYRILVLCLVIFLIGAWQLLVINLRNSNMMVLLHVFWSLRRISMGLILAVIIGIPLGIITGYFKAFNKLFSPLIYLTYPVPKIALLPIIMLTFGLGEVTKVIMIFLIIVFPIIINVRDEVMNMPEEIFYPMYSLGASNFQIVREIILPGIRPAILTSLRLGIGTSISVLFFTETFGSEYGLGYFIMDAWMRVNYHEMYLGIIVLSLLGVSIFILIDYLQNKGCPWTKM